MANKPNAISKPFFISFEGGEGAGKTTLIHQVEQAFRRSGFDVVKTREPGGSPLGERIRALLLNQDHSVSIGKMAELLLFLAARAQQIEQIIEPALAVGKIVLCDRFNDSTIAYQGAGRGLGIEKVEELCHIICGDIVPQLTLYLDVDPAVGLLRTQSVVKENARAGHVDRIEAEQLEFHNRLRQAYLSISRRYPKRFLVIDANRPAEDVFQEAMAIIRTHIPL
jgi:dTMP kinase